MNWLKNKQNLVILFSSALMLAYFLIGTPSLMDDGTQYEGFAQSLAKGVVDFKSYYGFQGLSFFAALVALLTKSQISIIITSIIFSLLSIPLIYLCAKEMYGKRPSNLYAVFLFLLMPYPYVTLMRGFQEAALLFFALLIIYGSLKKKIWTPIAWAIGGIVKPFALTLFPLFISDYKSKKGITIIAIALLIGGVYLGTSYTQTGHWINNAAVNSYQGPFDTGNPPPLGESFSIDISNIAKNIARVFANLFLYFRKILIAPSVVIIGAYYLWKNKRFSFRRRFISAILLNLLLVSLLTFSFSKYLLPAVTLLLLSSVPLLERYKWLPVVVLIDSLTVFWAIYGHFGHVFWPNFYVYLIPWYGAAAIYAYLIYESRYNHHSNS